MCSWGASLHTQHAHTHILASAWAASFSAHTHAAAHAQLLRVRGRQLGSARLGPACWQASSRRAGLQTVCVFLFAACSKPRGCSRRAEHARTAAAAAQRFGNTLVGGAGGRPQLSPQLAAVDRRVLLFFRRDSCRRVGAGVARRLGQCPIRNRDGGAAASKKNRAAAAARGSAPPGLLRTTPCRAL